MSVRNIYRTVKVFLFSSVNKQFLTFLFFLALSGVFWLILTLNETYEREFKVAVSITHVPKNVVLTSDETDTVRVTLRDKGWVLLGYVLGKEQNAVKVPFKTYARQDGVGSIGASDLRNLIYQRIEASSKITSTKPERLDFSYNYGEHKRVPLRWTGRVIPEQLYFISQVQYWPDSIDIYASKEKLDSIHEVYTEPLNYAGFRDTLTIHCHVAKQRDIKMVPEQVKVAFYTDVLTEESMDGVPIRCINMPEGKVLRTFPPKVKVHFVTGVSQFRSLKPEDFVVIADFREIMQKPSEKCNIYLQSSPHGISRATLDVKQVDYLIEEE